VFIIIYFVWICINLHYGKFPNKNEVFVCRDALVICIVDLPNICFQFWQKDVFLSSLDVLATVILYVCTVFGRYLSEYPYHFAILDTSFCTTKLHSPLLIVLGSTELYSA